MKSIINFLKGIVISVSTLVPGVSGGTMAIILGVYDDLIHAIGSFFQDWKKHSILILEIGLGGLVGMVLFSSLIEMVINNYPIQTSFFFIGVVGGGIPVLCKRATCKGRKTSDFLLLVIGLVIALAMAAKPQVASTMATAGGTKSFIFLIIAGIVMAVALILPGISGSFMLLILGLYEVTVSAISARNIPFLIPLSIGVLIGTMATTKIIEKLLKKYPGRTYMLILGFVLGSVLLIYPGMPQGINIIFSLASLAFGFVIIFGMGKKFQ
jgi:putative membrane protein